jgi:light-regulated signal transduction histidine kinase (bacteriophytochrome)
MQISPTQNSNVALLSEKNDLKDMEKALLNILDDYSEEKSKSLDIQNALLNILDDFSVEKENMENTQRAVLNILEDYSEEKGKVEIINNDLSTANKELEQFAYVASHDMQEPLRTISNFVMLLKEKYAGNTDEDIEQYIKFIMDATSRMQQLIKDLLDFSRIGRNTIFAFVDCNTIFNAVISDLALSIKESNAKITSANLPVVFGNEIELKQLLQNLITNAIKFQKKNVTPEITISAEEKDTEYFFSVKDNGIGIEEKYNDRIFIIFQRLHLTSDYPGTGIGLATCKKILSMHNGKIWIESKADKGSTFYFSIPKKKT